MRETLHNEAGLAIEVVLDDDTARVEIESDESGPDLSVPHEVVVVVDGTGRDVDVESPRNATATIVDELDDDPDPLTVMVRVHEFFDGWDLFVD